MLVPRVYLIPIGNSGCEGMGVGHAGEDPLPVLEPGGNLEKSVHPVFLFRWVATTRVYTETSSHFNLSVRAEGVKGLSLFFFVFPRIWHDI